MTGTLIYPHGATLPNARVTLTDDAGTIADLAGATVTVQVGTAHEMLFDKTDGITVSGGIATIDWDPITEIGALDPGYYKLDVLAQIGGEIRKFNGALLIRHSVGPATELTST